MSGNSPVDNRGEGGRERREGGWEVGSRRRRNTAQYPDRCHGPKPDGEAVKIHYDDDISKNDGVGYIKGCIERSLITSLDQTCICDDCRC